jgi:flagellar basal-body rod protein FlgB
MLIDGLFNQDSLAAMEATLQFTHARNCVLANNLANIDTPGFRMLRLDKAAFQQTLQDALDEQQAHGGPLRLQDSGQIGTGADGRVEFCPQTSPPFNLLFHDRTNPRLEQILADVADNNALHLFAAAMLGGRLNAIHTAIRGRVT